MIRWYRCRRGVKSCFLLLRKKLIGLRQRSVQQSMHCHVAFLISERVAAVFEEIA